MDAASASLPINLANLLHGRGVESVRVEFKAAWESNPASAALAAELIRSHAARGDLVRAERVRDRFAERAPDSARRAVADVLAAVRRGRRAPRT